MGYLQVGGLPFYGAGGAKQEVGHSDQDGTKEHPYRDGNGINAGRGGPGDAYLKHQDDYNRFMGLRGRVNQGLAGEQQAIDDWATKFKNDYKTQMIKGVAAASGNLMADSASRGYSGAMSRGAGNVGGQMRSAMPQAMEGMNRQMDMQQLAANYDQSQRAAQLELAQQDLMNTYQGGQASLNASALQLARGMDAANDASRYQNLGTGIGAGMTLLGVLSDRKYKKVY